jgi:gliding motility-associated-like protein
MKALLFITLLLFTNLYSQQAVELCPDTETTFFYSSQSSTAGGTYEWEVDGSYVGSGQSTAINWNAYSFGPHLITLTYYDGDLCPALPVTFTVNVDECPNSEMWAPNAFTPGGDELNNTWKPVGYNVRDVYFQIWNRWGEIIFESYDINVGWDGSYGGGKYFVQDGVYVYKLFWRDVNNRPYEKYGHVVLLR